MKKFKFSSKISNVIACLALMATVFDVNVTCQYFVHQPKLPEGAKKLRKF